MTNQLITTRDKCQDSFPRALKIYNNVTGSEAGRTEKYIRQAAKIPDEIEEFRLITGGIVRDTWLIMVKEEDWQALQDRLYKEKRCSSWYFLILNGVGLSLSLLASLAVTVIWWLIGATTSIETNTQKAFIIVFLGSALIAVIIMTVAFVSRRFPKIKDSMNEHHIVQS